MAKCPACGFANTELFFSIESAPVHSCILFDSPARARGIAQRPIDLYHCEICGFIFNSSYDASVQKYTPAYEEQQSFSPTFNAFSQRFAASLIDRFALNGKIALEVGCGKADFLVQLCELGVKKAIGIDPSTRSDRISSKYKDQLKLFPELLAHKHSALVTDIVLCRHTLEHIGDIESFLKILVSITLQNHCPLVIEVPDVTRVLEEGAFWDIYYEHCSYFSPHSLHKALRRSSSLSVEEIYLEYSAQYLIAEAFPMADRKETMLELPSPISKQALNRFKRKVESVTSKWKTLISEAALKGQNIAIWGSGSKCVSLLTLLDDPKEISAIVDINPHRHQKFLPGTGRQVLAPENLREIRPEIVIAMNPIYDQEIAASLGSLGVDSRLMTL